MDVIAHPPLSWLDGGPASIGRNNRAVDMARLIRGEKERERRDIRWVQGGRGERSERARTDSITANAFGGIHPSRIARETHQRVLGGGVGGPRGPAVNSSGRGRVDDGTTALRQHVPNSPPTRKHGSIQVNAQDTTPDVI